MDYCHKIFKQEPKITEVQDSNISKSKLKARKDSKAKLPKTGDVLRDSVYEHSIYNTFYP